MLPPHTTNTGTGPTTHQVMGGSPLPSSFTGHRHTRTGRGMPTNRWPPTHPPPVCFDTRHLVDEAFWLTRHLVDGALGFCAPFTHLLTGFKVQDLGRALTGSVSGNVTGKTGNKLLKRTCAHHIRTQPVWITRYVAPRHRTEGPPAQLPRLPSPHHTKEHQFFRVAWPF